MYRREGGIGQSTENYAPSKLLCFSIFYILSEDVKEAESQVFWKTVMAIVIKPDCIVTGNTQGSILSNHSILVKENRIQNIVPNREVQPDPATEVVHARGLIAIPGFVQTHIHLCQTLFRGMADDLELLDWLKKKIFPFEAAHNSDSMYYSSMLGVAELIRCGTTTILDMGSVNHEEAVIRAIGETGLRAFVGKAMMDINDAYPRLKETTGESLKSTRELAERWHNSYDGRLKYAVAPRFVLSCTDALLKEAGEMSASFDGMLFHTHASENKSEIQAVRKRCNMENIEFLDSLNVLSGKSCLAHCIHLNQNEMEILRRTGANVVHCPSSNLKLGSGLANVEHLLKNGINVTIGADGAPCNNNLNVFQEMRLTSLLQKPMHGARAMPAKAVFEMATMRGAKALGLDREIGSIEAGKKADIVLLDVGQLWNPVLVEEDVYSSIVYSCGPENVDSVMVDGKWVYRNKEYTGIDKHAIVHRARKEMKQLLERMS